MSIVRIQGPLVVPGAGPNLSALDYNDSAGPSAFAHGVGIVDNRFGPFGGGDITNPLPFWWGTDFICVINQAPATLAATNIVAAAVPVAGTAMTLAVASTGITVVPAGGFAFGTNTFPAAALMIDGNPAFISLAQVGGGMSAYDPRTTSQRALRFTSAGNDSSGTAAVVGYDFYGNIIHETVTLSNATVATSVKTYKTVASITPGGTLSGSNLSVGTSDVYGFPLASYEFQMAMIYWNAGLISATTGYTAAVTTSPATGITGDVRGKYAVQSASDGTKKLQVFIRPVAWQVTSAGLFGVTQF